MDGGKLHGAQDEGKEVENLPSVILFIDEHVLGRHIGCSETFRDALRQSVGGCDV